MSRPELIADTIVKAATGAQAEDPVRGRFRRQADHLLARPAAGSCLRLVHQAGHRHARLGIRRRPGVRQDTPWALSETDCHSFQVCSRLP
jgi:hypothetical protein